jgi:ParB family chromosome partitioning protein
MGKKANRTIDLDFLTGVGARTDLSSMFAASVAMESEMQQAIMVRIDHLLDNPYQPRLELREEAIAELAQVIKAQGFQGVLIARPHPTARGYYQLTAGHRRREAARRAGLTALPVVVRELTDEEMVTLAVTENIQREDLTPLEEGKIYLMMAEEMGFTHEQIAREVGKKRGYVENRIRVARAPGDVQALVQAKPDSIRAVANLIKVKDPQDRAEIIQQILEGRLTVEDLPGYIEAQAERRARPADGMSATLTANATSVNGSAQTRHGPQPQLRSQSQLHWQSPPHTEPQALAAQAAGQGDQEDEERNRARIGRAKLAAVLRYLNTYREQAAPRNAISDRERASLAQIRALVEELWARYGTQQ